MGEQGGGFFIWELERKTKYIIEKKYLNLQERFSRISFSIDMLYIYQGCNL